MTTFPVHPTIPRRPAAYIRDVGEFRAGRYLRDGQWGTDWSRAEA